MMNDSWISQACLLGLACYFMKETSIGHLHLKALQAFCVMSDQINPQT